MMTWMDTYVRTVTLHVGGLRLLLFYQELTTSLIFFIRAVTKTLKIDEMYGATTRYEDKLLEGNFPFVVILFSFGFSKVYIYIMYVNFPWYWLAGTYEVLTGWKYKLVLFIAAYLFLSLRLNQFLFYFPSVFFGGEPLCSYIL